MKNIIHRNRRVRHGRALIRLIPAGMAAVLACAQTVTAPAAPGTGGVQSPVAVPSTAKLQVEIIEIGDLTAFPSTITRASASGPFILHLVNKTHFAPPVLVWAAGAGAAVQPSALSAAADLTAFAHLPSQDSLVSLAPGTYLLQNATGRVYLTITIR